MEIKANVSWSHEDLVINLIKNDLIYLRLLHGLKEMTLQPDNYNSTLNQSIFWLLGIWDAKSQEEIETWYLKRADKAKKFKLSPANEEFDPLSREIFVQLKAKRDRLKMRSGRGFKIKG